MGGCAGRFDDDLLNKNSFRIKANAKVADLIFVGTITTLGPPPRREPLKAIQTVTYALDHTVKGSPSGSLVNVAHRVVSGSRHADPTAGQLSETMFAPGRTLIVFVKKGNSAFEDFDENLGTIPYSRSNEKALVKLLKGQ